MRTREVLRSLGFVEELCYKRDIDTSNRVHGIGEWHLRAWLMRDGAGPDQVPVTCSR